MLGYPPPPTETPAADRPIHIPPHPPPPDPQKFLHRVGVWDSNRPPTLPLTMFVCFSHLPHFYLPQGVVVPTVQRESLFTPGLCCHLHT